ncbi:MAG: HAD family phosphatase [Ruminococcaceae bacterium]|nr:HAD family phosphatase [Oscillospiraceae bacterium]
MINTAVKAVIFDKDGTLHDTEKVFLRAWKAAAEDCGGISDIEDTVRDCTGINLQDTAVYWAKKYPHISFEAFLAYRSLHFNEIIRAGVPVKPGAYELLEYLKMNDYKIGMATSTPMAVVKDHMERTDMIKYFDAIITGDMVTHGKPAPDIYLMAAEQLGVDPTECIGVEDSMNGVKAICAAGMRAVMIPDMIKPTNEIEKILWRKCNELGNIVEILEEMR